MTIHTRKSGSQETRCWRETDSNPRVPGEGNYVFRDCPVRPLWHSAPAAETGSFATRINAPQGIAGRAPGVGVDVLC